jgi:hypothetical protein
MTGLKNQLIELLSCQTPFDTSNLGSPLVGSKELTESYFLKIKEILASPIASTALDSA